MAPIAAARVTLTDPASAGVGDTVPTGGGRGGAVPVAPPDKADSLTSAMAQSSLSEMIVILHQG